MRSMAPRILIGCPTYDKKAYALIPYTKALLALTYKNVEILIVDTSEGMNYMKTIQAAGLPVVKGEWHKDPKERITHARNLLRTYAIVHGHDYFLSLEQDVYPEPETIERLLAHEKPYVTTVVLTQKFIGEKLVVVPLISVDWEGHPKKLRPIKAAEIQSAPLIPIKQAHLGCTLISREILKKHKFRHDKNAYDDTCLCEDILKSGGELWCDTKLRPVHQPLPPRGRKILQPPVKK